jgi:sulfate/thiosulfate transport system permease protein
VECDGCLWSAARATQVGETGTSLSSRSLLTRYCPGNLTATPLPLPGGRLLLRGVVMTYLSLIILLPLAAVIWKSTGGGWSGFRESISASDTVAAIRLTLFASLGVVAINALTGTGIAWVLVRDSFPGRALLSSVIDLPFALPTIVAGLTLLTLYGPQSPLHINAAYTRAGVMLALLFVTLLFVVRAVQPVLDESIALRGMVRYPRAANS